MYEFTYYTLCHPEYFETLQRYRASPIYRDILQSLIPESWTLSRSEIWLQANRKGDTLQCQGFKIHVSSSLKDAKHILQSMVPLCVDANVPFKIVVDPKLHLFLNSKRYHRSGSGKFATIYPRDEACFLVLIEALRKETADCEGPYVLSDRRYKNSKVISYRYGGFQPISQLKVDGTRQLMIEGIEGSLVPDERLPYFQMPAWIRDPILHSDPTSEENDSGLLNDRYEVLEALNFTNTGGVYRALDRTSNRVVVIKEARPHTLNWVGTEVTVDSIGALWHEHACLQRLQGLTCVPQVIEFYKEWEHTFLVTSYFDGIPLARLRALEEVIVLTNMDNPERIRRFCKMWRDICIRILDVVDVLHGRGVIVGDISPGNVLFNRDTEELVFIDFEAALLSRDDQELSQFGSRWFNPGFRMPGRDDGSLRPIDDFYACGILLYSILCPIQNLFDLDKGHPPSRVLSYFVAAGIPSQIQSIIEALLAGCVDEARRVVESWSPSEQVYGGPVLQASEHFALVQSLLERQTGEVSRSSAVAGHS